MKYLWRHLVAGALYFSFRKAEGRSEIESAEQETPSLSSGRKLVLHLEKSSSSVSLELKWPVNHLEIFWITDSDLEGQMKVGFERQKVRQMRLFVGRRKTGE